MAIFKPSNLSPNLTEVDVTFPFEIKFEVHTSGSDVNAYELKIYREFNLEDDDEDGEESVIYTQSGNFKNPLNQDQDITYTNGDTAIVYVPNSDTTGLSNENNYRWSIRVYQDSIQTDPSFEDYADNLVSIMSNSTIPTYAGETMIVGSTRDVIWSQSYNPQMKIGNYVECNFNSLNSDFNIFTTDSSGIRPTYVSFTFASDAGDVNEFLASSIYDYQLGSISFIIQCLKIKDIDKKYYEELVDGQYYLLISNNANFETTNSSGLPNQNHVWSVQIQDIYRSSSNNFYFVPYNQTFKGHVGRVAQSLYDKRLASLSQDLYPFGTPTSDSVFYYTIERRQRSEITDVVKNVGLAPNRNLTELLFDTPFDYSYQNLGKENLKTGIFNSPGIFLPNLETQEQKQESNANTVTLYIKPNIAGENILTPVEQTAGLDGWIRGGWILNGATDTAYGTINSLKPSNCWIKFGNYSIESIPFSTQDNIGEISYNIRSYNSSTEPLGHRFCVSMQKDPVKFDTRTSDNYVANKYYQKIDDVYTLLTSPSAPDDWVSALSGKYYDGSSWYRYDNIPADLIVGRDQEDGVPDRPAQFFNVQAYDPSDGKLIIKVPNDFSVNTDQFYTLYYVSSTDTDESEKYSYFLDSGFIGGGYSLYPDNTYYTRYLPSSFEVQGYNNYITAASQDYYDYNLFLPANNQLKPDRYKPAYLEIENDYAKIKGLITNVKSGEPYDRYKSVDKLDKTQYLCQFLTTTSLGDDVITKYGILEPQTKVKIYTQFADSVPQQYFYAREPLKYSIGVYSLSGDEAQGIIGYRNIKLKANRNSDNNTSNQIKYYCYKVYDNSDDSILYDSGNIYNASMEYILRGLPNGSNIKIELSYEDNLGFLQKTVQNFQVSYREEVIQDGVNVEIDCDSHANKISLSPSGINEIKPDFYLLSRINHQTHSLEIEYKGTTQYKTVNSKTDIDVKENSTVLIRMQFGENLVNSGMERPFFLTTVNAPTLTSESRYKITFDGVSFNEEDGIFSLKNETYRTLTLSIDESDITTCSFPSEDLTPLHGFSYMCFTSSESLPLDYGNRIPMILTAPTNVSGYETYLTYDTGMVSEGQFMIPSTSGAWIGDPAQSFRETELSQATYDVLFTTTSNPLLTVTKI